MLPPCIVPVNPLFTVFVSRIENGPHSKLPQSLQECFPVAWFQWFVRADSLDCLSVNPSAGDAPLVRPGKRITDFIDANHAAEDFEFGVDPAAYFFSFFFSLTLAAPFAYIRSTKPSLKSCSISTIVS